MEFNKYRDLGDYHWSQFDGETTYRQHVLRVLDWIEEGRVLDVGAGDGLITHQLALLGKDVLGIDNDPYALQIAKRKGVSVVFGDAYWPPRNVKKLGAVCMGDVVEHLETPEKSLTQIKAVLEVGGALYVVTPPQAPDGVVRDKYHYREYTPSELIALVEPLGFTTESVEVVPELNRMYAKFRVAP